MDVVTLPQNSTQLTGKAMIGSLVVILAGCLCLAIAITWAIGPVRLLAGLAAWLVIVPIIWAIVAAVVLAAWVGYGFHGG
jgi:hypothetical protein